MRKLFMFLALVLGVVSCQTEPEGFDVNMGGEQEVLINVSLPEETRADSAEGGITNVIASDDYTIRYIFQVYNAKGDEFKAPVYEYTDDTSVAFPVRLVPGRDYRFVVWADIVEKDTKADLHYNTAYFPAISLNQTWVAMDETRDAYTVSELVTDFHSGKAITLTLKRPLAKLRVITTDMAELLGLKPEYATVTYSTSHYNTFDALNSVVGDNKISGCEHANYTIKDDYEATNGKVLFTDYFFADNEVVNFHMSVKMSDGEAVERSFTTDIPVKRNYLTTIKGDILTDGNNIVVNVEEGFDDETIVNTSAKCSIYYTATSKIEIDPTKWGANIVSDEWNATTGRGVIGFDNDIKEIPYEAFKDNVNLTSIKIPETVTWIRSSAFHGCLNLAKFEGKFAADNGVCLIINNSFEYFALGCGLTEYVVPNSVKSINNSAFASCPSLMEVTIPENVNNIGFSAFKNCSNLKTVNIADSVTSIGTNAFYGCTNLVNINLPSNLSKIASSTFEGCTSIETIDIPQSVATIEDSAFENCQSLISIDLPQNITSIEGGVFKGCESLESITIPEGVSKIGTRAFYNCRSLDNITLPKSLREFGKEAFMFCDTLSNIVIPEGVCELPKSLFS
ncbi:MAG: leucine-rich repeat protein, partial [Alistipes sp.]|nr:leucine-rich repeat protein [Alistipes sp.]